MIWTEADQLAARDDGWMLDTRITSKRGVYVLKGWTNHEELRKHILYRAGKKEPLYLKLLLMLYQYKPHEYYLLVDKLPPNKGGELIKTLMTMARTLGAYQGDKQ
jgi:hypothetical protein